MAPSAQQHLGWADAPLDVAIAGAQGHEHERVREDAFEGDFYVATPTMRGVSLRAAHHDGLGIIGAFGTACWEDAETPLMPACGMPAGSGCGLEGCPLAVGAGGQRAPRSPPQDPLFPLERTTLLLAPPPNCGPEDVMNEYVHFLHTRTRSALLEADAGDFCAKAKLFSDSGSCIVVATLFGLEDGRYALECQRRYGDCVAFHRLFRQLAQHFGGWSSEGLCCSALGADAAFFVQPAAPICAVVSEEEDAAAAAAPLLDGALPPAEVAAALAVLARTAWAAVPLGSQRLPHVVRQLVQSGDAEAVYLVARALQELLRGPGGAGADFFSRAGLLADVEGGLLASRCAPVRAELAQVVAAVGRPAQAR